MALILPLIFLSAVEDAEGKKVGLQLLHLDTPKVAPLPVVGAILHRALAVQPQDIATAVLSVHQLPDDREAALWSAHRADAAGEVEVLSFQDDTGVAGHLHRDATLWEEGEKATLGLSNSLYINLSSYIGVVTLDVNTDISHYIFWLGMVLGTIHQDINPEILGDFFWCMQRTRQ